MNMSYIVVKDVSRSSEMDKLSRDGFYWATLGDSTIIWSKHNDQKSLTKKLRQANVRLDHQDSKSITGTLCLVIQVGSSFLVKHMRNKVIIDHGRYLVVDIPNNEISELGDSEETCWIIKKIPKNVTILQTLEPLKRKKLAKLDVLANQVSRNFYKSYIQQLTDFRTRHSTSNCFQKVTRWANNLFLKFGYDTKIEPINVQGKKSFNVVAEKKGSDNGTRKLFIITAHLDSINIPGGPLADSPGADDNASGSAGLMEIARILSAYTSRNDVRLILFGGEEQGLYGSEQYVNNLDQSDKDRIIGVINMDMIANLNSDKPTVVLEGSAISENIMKEIASSALTYVPSLVVQTSLHPFGSDHVSFLNSSIPAVLTIEGADRSNYNIHTVNDTIDKIYYPLALDILKINIVSAAKLLETNLNK